MGEGKTERKEQRAIKEEQGVGSGMDVGGEGGSSREEQRAVDGKGKEKRGAPGGRNAAMGRSGRGGAGRGDLGEDKKASGRRKAPTGRRAAAG